MTDDEIEQYLARKEYEGRKAYHDNDKSGKYKHCLDKYFPPKPQRVSDMLGEYLKKAKGENNEN